MLLTESPIECMVTSAEPSEDENGHINGGIITLYVPELADVRALAGLMLKYVGISVADDEYEGVSTIREVSDDREREAGKRGVARPAVRPTDGDPPG